MPDIKTPFWHVNGYQNLATTPGTMHWFFGRGVVHPRLEDYSPVLCYYAICGAYARVHFYIFTPIAFLNVYIESCNLGE